MSSPLKRTGHTVLLLGRSSVSSVVSNWGLACLSLVAAFGVWFMVQDVENPRTRAVVPGTGEQFIHIDALNVPDGYLVQDVPAVQVDVEARQSDIDRLSANDFHATVDVHALFKNGDAAPPENTSLNVTVTSRKAGVRVVRVIPSTVQVNVVQAEAKVFQVEIGRTGTLPDGFEEDVDQAAVDPAFVTVTGLPSLVDSIEKLEVAVPLNGVKDESFTYEGDVVALTKSGNSVTVNLSQARAKVTLVTKKKTSVKSVPVNVKIVGFPAPGYRITNIQVDPQSVNITGDQAVVNGLTSLLVDDIDVTNATTTFSRTPQIKKPPLTSLDRSTVTVTIEVKPIDCAGTTQAAVPCVTATVPVAPTFLDRPSGLVEEPAVYSAAVHVSGPADKIAALKPSDIKVTVSLATGLPGTGTYTPVAVAPTGIKVESVDPMTLKLIPAAGP